MSLAGLYYTFFLDVIVIFIAYRLSKYICYTILCWYSLYSSVRVSDIYVNYYNWGTERWDLCALELNEDDAVVEDEAVVGDNL